MVPRRRVHAIIAFIGFTAAFAFIDFIAGASSEPFAAFAFIASMALTGAAFAFIAFMALIATTFAFIAFMAFIEAAFAFIAFMTFIAAAFAFIAFIAFVAAAFAFIAFIAGASSELLAAFAFSWLEHHLNLWQL